MRRPDTWASDKKQDLRQRCGKRSALGGKALYGKNQKTKFRLQYLRELCGAAGEKIQFMEGLCLRLSRGRTYLHLRGASENPLYTGGLGQGKRRNAGFGDAGLSHRVFYRYRAGSILSPGSAAPERWCRLPASPIPWCPPPLTIRQMKVL